MSTWEMTGRTSGDRSRRVLAVWFFCVAAIAFWVAFTSYLTALPVVVAVVAAAVLALAVIPLARRIAYIVWEGDVDG